MVARVLVRPPSRPSSSAMEVRRMLGDNARLSRIDPIPRQYRYILNWGNPSSFILGRAGQRIINHPVHVAKAINKLDAFNVWKEWNEKNPEQMVNIPGFSLAQPGPASGIWVARSGLTLSGGRGITIIRDGVPAESAADLYVKYIPKLVEYRVHVVAGKVIFCQQKKREREAEQTADEKLIRNRDNGWVFCLVDSVAPEVETLAINAVKALGLDFGAIDLVVHKQTGVPYALECNTAPGLTSPSAIAAYKTAFSILTGEE